MNRSAVMDDPFQGQVARSANRRIIVLDILRAVAVLLVLGRHLSALPIRVLDSGPIQSTLAVLQRGGWVGVDIFFVLSGFLVSGLLFREYQKHQELRIGRFLLRRGLKIYPAFYTLIFFTLWLDLHTYNLPEALGEILFLQNYPRILGKIWPHTWTLAVEEHFYFSLALFLWLLVRGLGRSTPATGKAVHGLKPFRWVPLVTLLVGLVCLMARTHLAMTLPVRLGTHFFPTHLRIDSLLFGVCLSYWFHSKPEAAFAFVEARWRWLLTAGLASLTIPFIVPLSSPFLVSLGLTLIYLGAGMLLCGLMVGWQRPGPWALALAWWGGYSYSVYLWHVPIVYWIRDHLFETSHGMSPETWVWIMIALYLLASAVLGVVFARIVEFPVLRLRDRLFPSRVQSIGMQVSRSD